MNRRPTIKPILLFSAALLISSVALPQTAPLPAQPASLLQRLSSDFWEWRAAEQPFTFDDIPRLDRPGGWAADWSLSTIARRRKELTTFERRHKELGRG